MIDERKFARMVKEYLDRHEKYGALLASHKRRNKAYYDAKFELDEYFADLEMQLEEKANEILGVK